jgi:23S rRNA U2552 (ribose-2'-O)-methylase RlmE/FtsJ
MSYYNLSCILDKKNYKKICFSSNETYSQEQSGVINTYISNSLFYFLSRFKEQIELSAEAWDTIKKYTNPYEFIHTIIPGSKLSVSKMKPLSRSFYKMIELWKMFKLSDTRESMQTFHLAEGPGGFIEATAFLRKNMNDMYYGMTLINNDPGCPGWKKSHQFLESNKNVTIITGEDGTGNLLHKDNYTYCVNKFKHSMQIITADGGIDVSNDFNKQEELVSKLIVSEVIYAITMQKKGGHFVLKIFDIFSKLTIDILYILTRVYSEVYITKPFTSRLANSEKYIVCKNFLLDENESDMYISSFMNEFEKLMQCDNIVSLLSFDHDYYFLNKIEEINIIMGQKQLENIITTLNIIGSRNNHDKIDSLKKINIQKCILWCEKYDIPCIKLVSSNNIFLSGIYDENGVNTNTSGGSNGGSSGSSIGSNNNSFKRNTFLKNKNHTHKNNSNRKIEINIVIPVATIDVDVPCIPDISDISDIPVSIQYAEQVEQVEQVEHDDSNTNIISTIIENIIEKVKNNYG